MDLLLCFFFFLPIKFIKIDFLFLYEIGNEYRSIKNTLYYSISVKFIYNQNTKREIMIELKLNSMETLNYICKIC